MMISHPLLPRKRSGGTQLPTVLMVTGTRTSLTWADWALTALPRWLGNSGINPKGSHIPCPRGKPEENQTQVLGLFPSGSLEP